MPKRRPVDMAKYPPNWREISKSIRERAGGKCEWCGIPNYSNIHRLRLDPFQWVYHTDWLEMPFEQQGQYNKVSKIFLTVSHFDHDTTHNDPSNLNALCNRCHLKHDAYHHAANAKATRAAKREAELKAAGQLGLFEVQP